MESVASKPKSRGKRILERIWKERVLWLMVLPGVIWYIVFKYLTMAGVLIAFQRYTVSTKFLQGEWVGFRYFGQFFRSESCWKIIRNTFLISLYSLIWSFPAPIVLAIALSEIRHPWYKKLAQTVSYLPYFISTVIIVGMIINFLSPTSGVVNTIIKAFGKEPINFLVYPRYFRTIYIASGIWQGVGYGSIIYLAAISGLDPQLYEAARVDGCSRVKQIWYITLPGILPTVTILLILNLGGILSVGYEKILLLYNTNTYETADVISTYVYRRGIAGGEFSFGTAVNLFSSVVNLVFLLAANWIAKKVGETSLW
ncbi:MAG: ABC transporter permease [Eubacteriales bacterium]